MGKECHGRQEVYLRLGAGNGAFLRVRSLRPDRAWHGRDHQVERLVRNRAGQFSHKRHPRKQRKRPVQASPTRESDPAVEQARDRDQGYRRRPVARRKRCDTPQSASGNRRQHVSAQGYPSG